MASQKRVDLAGGQALLSRCPAGLHEHELLLVGFRLRFETLLLGRRELRLFGETLRRRREELRRLRVERLLLLFLLLSEQVLRLLEHQRLLLLNELLLSRGRGERRGPLEVEFGGPLELRLELLQRTRAELLRRRELRLRLELMGRGGLGRLELLSSRHQRLALVDGDAGLLFGYLLENDRVVLTGRRIEHEFGGVKRRVSSGHCRRFAYRLW